MARPLRIEYPGACYHVTSRGNRREVVFHTSRQYDLFVAKLERSALQFGVRVHAYCLLPNHFHLLLTTRDANLSRFMQSLLTAFTVAVNRMQSTPGHVFQGRFKAHLVEAQRYLSEVSRYIHLNPVRTAQARALNLEERRAALLSYRWSSYAALIGLQAAPAWLDIGPVLQTWGEADEARMPNYRQYVEQGLTADTPNPFAAAKAQSILGSEGFVDVIRRRYLLARAAKPANDVPALRQLTRSLEPQQAAAAVAGVYGVAPEQLLKRRSAQAEARRVLMYVVAVHCRHARSLASLAAGLATSVAGLCTARLRVERALAATGNRALKARVQQVEQALQDGRASAPERQ